MTRSATHIIHKLLGRQGRVRTVAATLVLFIGTSLLSLSVLVWWNFSLLVAGERRQEHSSFLVVGKVITERNMGGDNSFTTPEIEELRAAPGVTEAEAVTPALFPVYATLGGTVAMSTDLPLAGVPDRFLDTIPPGWAWQPGQRDLPIIVSSQFFDIYNYVFAPGQGLPQLSHKSATMISLKLRAGGQADRIYNAHVVGFTERYGSVLAPQSFIEYGNRTFAAPAAIRPTQVALKVTDAADEQLNLFLQQKGYTTNTQNLRWSQLQRVVNAVSAVSGIVALLLVGISGLVFSLFIQLTLARAHNSLSLLRQLGYNAGFLRKVVYRRILPWALAALAGAIAVASIIQFALAGAALQVGLSLPRIAGWPVWLAVLLAGALLTAWLAATTRKIIRA